nr:MAG: hypothetical protein [Caudoviricetes sp.]
MSEKESSIWERYYKLQNNRRTKNSELMKEYDESVYYPALRSLQEECEKEGHSKYKFVLGVVRSWWVCGKCGKSHSFEEQDD